MGASIRGREYLDQALPPGLSLAVVRDLRDMRSLGGEGHRLGRSQALRIYFLFLELRHQVELHQVTGRVAERPVDEMKWMR